MAITVRKKMPITVNVSDHETAGAAAPASEPKIVFTPPTFLQSGPSYTPYAVCALIAVLLFAVLLFLQWTEWDGYKDAFPVPTATAQSAPAPAASSTTAE